MFGNMTPVEAGHVVTFEVAKDLFTASDVFYFAMMSLDEANLRSPMSSPFQLIVDILPPNRVTDLKASLLGLSVAISFTAPGDDNNQGTGTI